MQANEITFGIEIECFIPAAFLTDNNIQIGAYHHGRQIEQLPIGWNAQRDGSLDTTQYNMIPVEIVSPVLKGVDGINQIRTVLAWINAAGGSVNKTCGLHVHVGAGHLDGAGLARLICLVANHEKGIFASTGTQSRETNRFCKSIKTNFKTLGQMRSMSSMRREYHANDRYHVLNLENLASGRRPTVEFRAFAGTLNVTKIIGYVQICVGLMQRATVAKKSAPWESKATFMKKPGVGEGQAELNRLFMTLRWIAVGGKASDTKLGLIEEGTLKETKAKLIEMAKKYDSLTVQPVTIEPPVVVAPTVYSPPME